MDWTKPLARSQTRTFGVQAALFSALFLGLSPVLGKQAILFGFSPLLVVAFRTTLASGLLAIAILLYKKQFFYIYPVGLLGCMIAGSVNGFGSLLYYSALGRLDASLGQVLYSFYPHFVALILIFERQSFSKLTLVRLLLTLPAVYLLVKPGHQAVDLLGALMMLISAFLYGLHLLINQRILYDVPAPTVALYTLLAMSVITALAYLFTDLQMPPPLVSWLPVIMLAGVTFLSRVALFSGVKHLGGLQTALLGLSELFVTLLLAFVWLGERFSLLQWIGAALLAFTILLVGFDKFDGEKLDARPRLFTWLYPKDIPGDIRWS